MKRCPQILHKETKEHNTQLMCCLLSKTVIKNCTAAKKGNNLNML